MYKNHFSLRSLPFENVPDPVFFFDKGDYNRIFNRMIDSLVTGKGLMVVAGPIGTGKTTLSQKLMASVSDKTRIIWLGEPPDTSEDLLLFIAQELHLSPKSSSRTFILRDIKECLLSLRNEGNSCLLIMDEMHKVSDDVLECIRILNNLEQGSMKLLQILLLGQEEFLVNLSRPELESFKQRIAWLEALGKMTPPQIHDYIVHRLKVSGSNETIFTEGAMEAMMTFTRGTPRLVNTFCDRALRVSYESGKTIVDLGSVRQAADEIGLGTEVFLWLTRRNKLTARTAELEPASVENSTRHAAVDARIREPAPVDEDPSIATIRGRSKWSVVTVVDKIIDMTIGTMSEYPILQLIVSILVFAASIKFLIITINR